MKPARKSVLGHKLPWTVALAMILISSIHLIQSQPQKYFRGNGVSEIFARNSKNKITPLPSKALPRIGRRGGGDLLNPAPGMEEHYGVIQREEIGNGNSKNIKPPFGAVQTSSVSRFAQHQPSAITRDKLLLVIKYLIKHGFIRPGDSTLSRVFNGQ